MRARSGRSPIDAASGGTALVVLAYCALATAYALRLPFVMDEFQGASAVDRLLGAVPYRDFTPYKNVLGYYLQLPVLAAIRDPWWGLVGSRLLLVLLNLGALCVLVSELRRLVRPTTILLAMPLLVFMTTFLERSWELRVDQMSGWLGAFGILALITRRPFRAGILIGLAFLVSQKAIYFAVAAVPAAAVLDRARAPGEPRGTWRFLAALALPVAAYLALWSITAGMPAVLDAVFGQAATVAVADVPIRRAWMWMVAAAQNPIFWIAMVGGIVAGARGPRAYRAGAVASGVLVILAIAHRQPWPYFIASMAPSFAIAIAMGCELWIDRYRSRHRAAVAGAAAYGALGLAWPLSFVPIVLERTNEYQRSVVDAAARELRPGGTYLAGLHLVRFQRHSPPSLGWLDAGRLAAVAEAGEAGVAAYIDTLIADPPDLVVDTYRIRGLPCGVRVVLDSLYRPLSEGLYRRVIEGETRGGPLVPALHLFPRVNNYWASIDPPGPSLPPGGLVSGCGADTSRGIP